MADEESVSLAAFACEPVSLVGEGDMPRSKVNPNQDYRNREDVQQLHETYLQMADSLHGARSPELVIEHEKPEHRLVLLLKLKGATNREIAKQLNFSEAWVSQITRQPWFQERLTNELSRAGEDILENLVKLEGRSSFATLLEMRDDPKVPANVRANICIDIINRNLGKPIQRTENTTTANVFHVSTKLEDINKQLKEVEEAEAKLLGRGTTLELPESSAGEPTDSRIESDRRAC